jgi:hypothetical protein
MHQKEYTDASKRNTDEQRVLQREPEIRHVFLVQNTTEIKPGIRNHV